MQMIQMLQLKDSYQRVSAMLMLSTTKSRTKNIWGERHEQ